MPAVRCSRSSRRCRPATQKAGSSKRRRMGSLLSRTKLLKLAAGAAIILAVAIAGLFWVSRNALCFGYSCLGTAQSRGDQSVYQLDGRRCFVTTELLISTEYRHLRHAAIARYAILANYFVRPFDLLYIIPAAPGGPVIVLDPSDASTSEYFDFCADQVVVLVHNGRYTIQRQRGAGG